MNSNWDGINNQLAQRDMFFTITPRVGVGNPNRCVCDILEPPKCIHSSKFTPLSPFFLPFQLIQSPLAWASIVPRIRILGGGLGHN